ncbi:protein kinase [Chloropicon primus]|uniref:Protein kinase n=1 Tax=Chloropicon primus TaxID=1764295 RepID=A0A5B8MBF9_9CHLO|nr:protein kinase [Chloropicon primus]UPQ96944.1 protein kinase [Chloropicon primus]|eukprot:QDZ17727.1 protein kinase [Chloropicon primus]
MTEITPRRTSSVVRAGPEGARFTLEGGKRQTSASTASASFQEEGGGQIQHTTLRCFDASSLDVIEMIGIGKSAITVKARLSNYGLVAVKCIPVATLVDEEEGGGGKASPGGVDGMDVLLSLPLEILLHSLLDHERIPRLIGVCMERTEILMIQELVAPSAGVGEGTPSDLWSLLYAGPRGKGAREGGGGGTCLDLGQILRTASDVAEALEHLHSKGICHCDINPKNILIGEGGRAFLTDFGCARRLSEQRPSEQRMRGCTNYAAPEVVSGGSQRASAKSDMYSFGGVLLEMAVGRMPWEGLPDCEIEYQTQVRRRSALDHSREMGATAGRGREVERGRGGEAFAELLRGLLSFDPGDRPSASTARAAVREIGADGKRRPSRERDDSEKL